MHTGGEDHAERFGVLVEHLVELVHLRRDRHRGEEADEHRRAAERRRRLRVHVPRVTDGATTAPSRIASNRTSGVSASVTASATARTIA